MIPKNMLVLIFACTPFIDKYCFYRNIDIFEIMTDTYVLF